MPDPAGRHPSGSLHPGYEESNGGQVTERHVDLPERPRRELLTYARVAAARRAPVGRCAPAPAAAWAEIYGAATTPR